MYVHITRLIMVGEKKSRPEVPTYCIPPDTFQDANKWISSPNTGTVFWGSGTSGLTLGSLTAVNYVGKEVEGWLTASGTSMR